VPYLAKTWSFLGQSLLYEVGQSIEFLTDADHHDECERYADDSIETEEDARTTGRWVQISIT